ncbi:MAG: hypothetical protein J1F43_01800 [Muribaculaceae bacterium]|nr:hypothetical protein [Muribaculaceae bacterium]
MSKYYDNSYSSGFLGKPRRNPLITVLKAACWVVGILAVCCGVALWIISAYLSPSRITRLIEEESSEYLNARISIGRLNYKIFSTYPWLFFEVDSLSVISKSLDTLSSDQLALLPQNSDSLASVATIKGKVNIHDLIRKKIRLKDIEVTRPEVNIVIYNDSITNFNIARKTPEIKSVPNIDISEIKMEAPLRFSFFSLPSKTEAGVDVESFYLLQNPAGIYEIGFDGNVAGRYQEWELPQAIPLSFKTELQPQLPDLALQINRLSLGFANLMADIRGDMLLTAKSVNLKKAAILLSIDDVFSLMGALPETLREKITLPEGLAGTLPLQLDLYLSEPYQISLADPQIVIPAMGGRLLVDGGEMELQPAGMKRVSAKDIFLDLEGKYNPEDSAGNSLELRKCRLEGEGVSLWGHGIIVQTNQRQLRLNGDFRFDSNLMETLSYVMPRFAKKVKGHLKGDVKVVGLAENFGKEGFKNIRLVGKLGSRRLQVNYSPANIALTNFKSDFKAVVPSYPLSNYDGTKLQLILTADSISAVEKGLRVAITDLLVDFDAMDTVSGNPAPNGDLLVKIKKVEAGSGATSFNADKIDLNVNGKLLSGSSSSSSYNTVAATHPGEDALIASRSPHTPLVVEYAGGGILSSIMGMVSIDAEMRMEKGDFITPDYLYPVSIQGLDLSSNLNRVNFFASNLKIADTGCSITGVFEGLKPFLTSYSATPLQASADIAFTNVDINQLSWGYYGAQLKKGQPYDSVFYVAPMTPFTASDSVCVAIPRNIDATIRLRSNAAEYMQYKFSPLSTDIIVRNGVAILSRLSIGTPYCNAVVDWTYSTSSLNDIYMDLKAKVENFSFSPFYKVFPQLIDKAAELQNFTGVINADIDCRFGMFPDMFMNSESLTADFKVTGSDLQFARHGKIERITHLMLIEGDHPIQIQNLNITGSLHDNLLQVNPFTVAFDDYRLKFAGVNNLSGKMYYHIALEKSPFHLPFGVSIFGNMKKPEVRLGGTHIDDYRSEMVASREGNHLNANIMAYLHHGWLLFVQEAAKYKATLSEETR